METITVRPVYRYLLVLVGIMAIIAVSRLHLRHFLPLFVGAAFFGVAALAFLRASITPYTRQNQLVNMTRRHDLLPRAAEKPHAEKRHFGSTAEVGGNTRGFGATPLAA